MQETTPPSAASRPAWPTLEAYARAHTQTFVQRLREEEVDALRGRPKSEGRAPDAPPGYRNGHGRPRRLALTNGTITVRRPRLRDPDARFERRVLPLCKRRSAEVGGLLPELYLHGLATRDFELALRGLLGDGAPISARSIQRLNADWPAEHAYAIDRSDDDTRPRRRRRGGGTLATTEAVSVGLKPELWCSLRGLTRCTPALGARYGDLSRQDHHCRDRAVTGGLGPQRT